ncbi:hypothetical protein Peur_005654 [Populus x canadensis]
MSATREGNETFRGNVLRELKISQNGESMENPEGVHDDNKKSKNTLPPPSPPYCDEAALYIEEHPPANFTGLILLLLIGSVVVLLHLMKAQHSAARHRVQHEVREQVQQSTSASTAKPHSVGSSESALLADRSHRFTIGGAWRHYRRERDTLKNWFISATAFDEELERRRSGAERGDVRRVCRMKVNGLGDGLGSPRPGWIGFGHRSVLRRAWRPMLVSIPERDNF